MTVISVLSEKNTDMLVSGGLDGYVCLWDLRSSEVQHKVQAVQGSVNALKIAQDPASYIVVAGSDKMVRVLDPRKNFQVCKELQGHKDIVTCLSLVCNCRLWLTNRLTIWHFLEEEMVGYLCMI